MAKYRLTNPAFVSANGRARRQHFKAGAVITVSDDFVPSDTMVPLDAAANAATAAKRGSRPHRIARNGVQSIDTRTGHVRVTRHNESRPR